MVGSTVSHYKILEKLGEGGMGVVYKAHDTKLDRNVALKFLPTNIISSADDIARFEQEAKAISALNHQNIATIFDVDDAEGRKFLVLEFIPGGTLKSKIKKLKSEDKEFSIADVIDCGTRMAEGLAHAHKHHIVHRDIKSDNVMLTEEGIVKITDFGLAKLQGASHLTRTGSTVGTLAYMAPEQLRGEDIDHRADLFSLGVVLYEMTTSRLPFRGEHDAALTYSIANEEPLSVKSLRQSVPPALETIIMKCLQKDRTLRYQTADEIAADLGRLRHETIGSVKTVVATERSKLPWIIAAAVVLAAAGVYLFMPSAKNVQNNEEVKTIAVLPFSDMSPNRDQEYFSDGLSEEVLNVLAKNPKLRVTSRTSAFSFKGTNTDIKTIASKLNVKHILEGSVRKSGNALRITAQLIDVETDAHLWSDTYDGTMDNVFAVQDTISRSVAEALNIALLGKEDVRKNSSPEAYNAYLLGNHFFDLRGRENLEKSIGYYKYALSIDSNYAHAWERLAAVHSTQADNGYVAVDEGYRQARQEAERALGLDPNLADAHVRMGWIQLSYDWNWSGADESYRRALELDPGNAGVISAAASLSRTRGRSEEAILLLYRAVELDPVRPIGYNNLGVQTYSAGLLDESLAAFRKVLELNPEYPGAHMNIGRVYLEKRKPDSALAEMMAEPQSAWQMCGLALVYFARGNKEEASNVLAQFIKEYENDAAYQIAEIYAYWGDVDKSFEWLERAYKQRDGGLSEMKADPLLRNIEKDPRYAAFMRKMKLPL
jgi:serine/threonine protein kinase/tetratricopeptide (TPR) repeat protein